MDYIIKPVNLQELLVRVDNQFKITNLIYMLNKQRNEMESIFQHSTGSLVIVDNEFVILEFNNEFKKMTEYCDELQGKNFFELIHNESKELLDGFVAKVRDGKDYENIHIKLIAKNSAQKILNISLTNIKNQDKVLISIFDKTKLVENETKMKETQMRLFETQKLSKTASWTLDIKSNNITFDKQVDEIMDIDIIKKLTLKDFYDLILPQDVAALSALFQDAIYLGVPFTHDFRVVHENKLRYFHIGCSIKYDDNKHIIGLFGLLTDTTENSQLLHKMKDYVKLVEQNIVTSKSDLEGKITYVSEAFCKISGYTKSELMGQNHSILRHPEMPDSLYQDLWDTIKSGNTWVGEIKNLKKNGEDYWVEATIYPEFDYKNEIIGYTAIRKEITLKKLHENS